MTARATVVLVIALTGQLAAQQPTQFLLFGAERDGRGHDVFFGCLNCVTNDARSVCNPRGKFGNRFLGSTIWSRFGAYGSSTSNTSPWNIRADNPPVIVDPEGNFLGYLTANTRHPQRTRAPVLLALLERAGGLYGDLTEAREAFCQ